MSFIIFDCETTGFYNPNFSATHPSQARICSLAAIKLDKELNQIDELYSLIKPAGWTISKGASEANGLTNEICEKDGKDIKDILPLVLSMCADVSLIITHNAKFDSSMICVEIAVLNNYDSFNPKTNPDYSIANKQLLCTMNACTPICKLPFKGKRTFGREYKWPKLEEVHMHLFYEKIEGAHNALNDCRATTRIFKHLVQNKLISV